jgi:hypothetical protein
MPDDVPVGVGGERVIMVPEPFPGDLGVDAFLSDQQRYVGSGEGSAWAGSG